LILFHEGNISEEHQKYINEKSDGVNIQYIDLSDIRKNFSDGYWFMCRFWALDFLKYLSDYDFVIRIDDDCDMIDVNQDELSYIIDNDINYSTGAMISSFMELNFRREWHKQFLNDYCVKNNIQRSKSFDEIMITYPNFMIINVPYYNNSNMVQNFLNEIINGNWTERIQMGDANIWGMIIDYLDNIGYYNIKNIRYYHHSHQKMVYGTINNDFGYMVTDWK
jgi:hypothetical protein